MATSTYDTEDISPAYLDPMFQEEIDGRLFDLTEAMKAEEAQLVRDLPTDDPMRSLDEVNRVQYAPMAPMVEPPQYVPENTAPPRSIVPFQMPPVPPGFTPPWNPPPQYQPETPPAAPIAPPMAAPPVAPAPAAMAAPAPVPVQPPPAAPLPPPAPRIPVANPPLGKIYMGPRISQEEFEALPMGARVMPPPPVLSEEQQAAMQRRLVEGTRPKYDTRLTDIDPTMRRFAAQDQINRAVAKGMTMRDAMNLYGQDLFGPRGGMTQNQMETSRLKEMGIDIARERNREFERTNKAKEDIMRARATVRQLTPEQMKQLDDARSRRRMLMAELADPQKIMSRRQIAASLAAANQTIANLERAGGLEPEAPAVVAPPPPPGSTRDNPIEPKSKAEASKLPTGTWIRDPKGNVILKK